MGREIAASTPHGSTQLSAELPQRRCLFRAFVSLCVLHATQEHHRYTRASPLHKSITVVHLTWCCDICESLGQRVCVSNLSRERTLVGLCVPSLHYRAISNPQNTQKKRAISKPQNNTAIGGRRCHLSSQARTSSIAHAHTHTHTRSRTRPSLSLSLFLSTVF